MIKQTPKNLLLSTIALVVIGFASAASAQLPLPTFAKSFLPATIGPDGVSMLRFNIANSAPQPLANLAFTDTLPAGVTIASPPGAFTSCGGGGIINAFAGDSSISYSGGTLGAAASCFVRVNVTSSTPGTHTNTSGDLTSDAGNSGSASADLTVATDRPGFSKSFSPSVVSLGGRSTLVLTIDNTANTAAAANLTFTDTLPTGMTIASPSNKATTCSGGTLTAPVGGGVISYTPAFSGDATVAAMSSCTVVVDVLGNATGSLANVTGELTSTQTAFSTTRSSGKASAVLDVTANKIVLTKAFVDDPAPPGGTATLRFTIRNLDRGFDATSIAFDDDLDAALAGLEAGAPLPLDPCGNGSTLSGTGLLSLANGSLGAAGTCTFEVTVQLPAAAASGVYTNTTTEITAEIDGATETGDPATDLLFVEPAPILTKTFLNEPVGGGDSIVLEFTLTNSSSTSTATGIGFEDIFGEELPTASSVPAAGFCGPGSTATYTPLVDPPGSGSSIPARLVIAGAELAPSASCTFSITLGVLAGAAPGIYVNTTSEITATVDGQGVVGAPASGSFGVVAAPTLLKRFIGDPAAPGDTVTLEFSLSYDENSGGDIDSPAEAFDITFSDDLTAALAGLTAVGLPLNDVCGAGSQIDGTTNLTFTGGTLAIDETCIFGVTLQVPATAPAGSHPNTTSNVVATVLGIPTVGNQASDSLKIAGLTLTKEFIDDPVQAGGTATLRFTIQNISPVATATAITFDDDLDDTLENLVATGLPPLDPCGTGSSLTAVAGGSLLVFRDGSLAPGASCTFDVVLQIPAATPSDTYVNTTTALSATIDGSTVFFDPANDELVVDSDLVALTKEFTDDPAAPGGSVNLRFTLTNLSPSQALADLAFSDDLDAALAGLAATGLPIAACGGTVSGTTTISYSGGTLAVGETCSFDVAVSVPSAAPLGSVAVNTTSSVTGTAGGLPISGDPASDSLRIDFLSFSKSFAAPAEVGGTAVLTFNIQNLDTTNSVADLGFTDDLDAVLAGLVAVGLPANDVCGAGSQLAGTSLLTLSGGNLLPGGSCTFSVDLAVPSTALPDDYLNVTSDLLLTAGVPGAAPATATLTVIDPADDDNDGVPNSDDLCPGTVIPEGVPTVRLGTNRYALVDGDTIFDIGGKRGGGGGGDSDSDSDSESDSDSDSDSDGPPPIFTVNDTGGCSCEQIIEARGLGLGHVKFGCSRGEMEAWVAFAASGGTGFSSVAESAGGRQVCVDCGRGTDGAALGLTVIVDGKGDVTSSRAPLADGRASRTLLCSGGATCATDFAAGSTLLLFARPVESDSEFAGWSGDCQGSGAIASVTAKPGAVCRAVFRSRTED